MFTTIIVGTGKAIHWGTDCGALCGAGFNNGRRTGVKVVKADAVTCKRCLKGVAARVEDAHAEALELDEQRTIARAYASTPSGAVLTWEEIAELVAARDAENEARLDAAATATTAEEVPTAEEIEVEQLWVSKATGATVRILDKSDTHVQARDVEGGPRFWLTRQWMVDYFSFKNEPGTEPFRRTAQSGDAESNAGPLAHQCTRCKGTGRSDRKPAGRRFELNEAALPEWDDTRGIPAWMCGGE